MLRGAAVPGAVVLVHRAEGGDQEIGTSEEGAGGVVQVHLRLDRTSIWWWNRRSTVSPADSHRAVARSYAVRATPDPGAAAGQDGLHAIGVEVAGGEGGVDHDDQVEYAEVACRAQEDLLGRVDRETVPHLDRAGARGGLDQPGADESRAAGATFGAVHRSEDGHLWRNRR